MQNRTMKFVALFALFLPQVGAQPTCVSSAINRITSDCRCGRKGALCKIGKFCFKELINDEDESCLTSAVTCESTWRFWDKCDGCKGNDFFTCTVDDQQAGQCLGDKCVECTSNKHCDHKPHQYCSYNFCVVDCNDSVINGACANCVNSKYKALCVVPNIVGFCSSWACADMLSSADICKPDNLIGFCMTDHICAANRTDHTPCTKNDDVCICVEVLKSGDFCQLRDPYSKCPEDHFCAKSATDSSPCLDNFRTTCICAPVTCTRPRDLARNVEATETTLSQTGFNVTLKCKTGFTGSPSAEACSGVGAYKVTGICHPITCSRPHDLGNNVEATETTLTQEGFNVTLRCKTGFRGSPSAEACSEVGAYKVTGICDPITCTRPHDLANNVEATETTLTPAGFNVTLKCKTGFLGSPSAEACSEVGAYTVTGICEPITCSRPNDIASNVEATEITLTQTGFNVTLRCKPGFIGSPSAEACSEDGAYTVTGICHPEAATTTRPSKSTTVPIAANTANTVLSTSAAISTTTNTTSTATTTTPTRTTSTTTVSTTITTTTTSATTTSTSATIGTTTATPATITTTPTSTRSAATSSSTAATTTSTATAATTTITSTPATPTLTTRAAPATTTTATNNAVTKAVTSSTAARSIRITTTALATDLAGCSSSTGCNGIDILTGTGTRKPTTSFTPTGAAQPRWVAWLIVILAVDAFAFVLCLVAMRIYPNYAVDLYRRLAVLMPCFCGKKGNEGTQEGFCEEDPAIANMEGLQANCNISGHEAMLPVATTTTRVNRSTSPSHEHHLDTRDGQATKRSSTRSASSAKYSKDSAVGTCQNKMPQFGHPREPSTLGIQDVTVRTSSGKELLQPSSDSLNPMVSDSVVPESFFGAPNEATIEEKSANDGSGCPPGTPSRHSTTRAGNWRETS